MKNSTSPKTKNRARVLGTLFLVFWLTATLTFGARRMLGRSLDAQPTKADVSSAAIEPTAIPRLPADTEDKLAAALEPTIAPVNVSSDPFSDRAGLANPNQIIQTSSKPMTLVSTGLAAPVVPLIPDRMARLSQWQQSVRSAASSHQTLPPITNAYLISEMAPSGKFFMNGHLGAWLYIDAEKRTISANVGSKFYDGMLVGVSESGVQFMTSANQTRTIPWARQDDFGAPPTIPVDPRPALQGPTNSPPKPISDVRGPNNYRRVNIQNEYDDLQVAVKDRYVRNNPGIMQSPPEAPASNVIKPATISPNDDDRQSNRQNFNHVNRTIALTRDENPIYLETAEIVASNPQPTQEPSPRPSPSPAIAKVEPSPVASASPVSAPKKETSSPTLSASLDTSANRSKPEAPSPAAKTEPINHMCDAGYIGDKINISNESGRPLSLLTFVNRLNADYNANIVLDYDIQETPIRLTVNDAPWTSILRTVLDLNDLDAVCVDGHIAQVAKRSKIAQISEQRRRNAPIVREVFKLRYLQPTAGGRTNLAGQTQSSTGANIQTLEAAIRDILKAGGDSRGDARQVPGHNEIFVAATQEQMGEIRQLIERVDRPGYQVKISALVYTANDNRLRDIGSQLSIAAFSLNNNNVGGLSTLPNNTATGSGSGSGTGTGSGSSGSGVAGSNPGGIPGLLSGMRQPSNGLGASNPLITLGGGMVFPSGQFALQITAAQQSGAINIQSRPFGLVADGETLDLNAGIQIPVVTTTIAGGAPFQSGQVQFIEASRLTQINPQVAEDDNGKPAYVTLNLRLENNSVDTSLGTFNGIPGVNRQSLQTVLRLRNGETAVIGGLAADQVSEAKSKVPGLGDLPIIGHAFKRKQNQENRDRLYFAITVEVVPQDAAIPGFPAPADAFTSQPQPPTSMKPSPFEKRN